MLLEHQMLLEGKGEIWIWNFLAFGSLWLFCLPLASTEGDFCMCNSSPMNQESLKQYLEKSQERKL